MIKNTRFTAFYSYKGGVGRSLALANLAYLLAYQGRKVLIIDMDLEAPGQHATDLFKGEIASSVRPVQGIMDLLEKYEKERQQLAKPENKLSSNIDEKQWQLNDYIIRSNVFDKRIEQLAAENPDAEESLQLDQEEDRGAVWLMPASGKFGNDFADYKNMLSNWHWDKFYQDNSGAAFIRLLKNKIRQADFDYVLIDSRTGFSDIFYTTTLLLAETVICVSGFNRQNIEGTAHAIETISDPLAAQHYGKKRIILIGSPVPIVKDSIKQAREIEIAQEWPEFKNFHWDVNIPYVAELMLREEILSMDPSEPLSSQFPYIRAIVKLSVLLKNDKASDSIEHFIENKVINPFPAIRVEYWNESEVVNHFVDPGNNIRFALEQFMPTVVFGSRGTGKTMLARWFDYETIAYRLEQAGLIPGPENTKQIGLWFRLDIDLLNVFNCDIEGPREKFNLLFGQFLDLLFLRKALKALEKLGGLEQWLNIRSLCLILKRETGSAIEANNYEDIEDLIEQCLWEIRAYINNPSSQPMPFIIQSNILLKELVRLLRKSTIFTERGHYFSIFIDEYENFHAYQQCIVNTRLKQAKESDRVTYNLLARNDGIHTYQTLSKGQPLELTHDLRDYNLDERVTFQEFKDHITKVVNKHLTASSFFSRRDYNNVEKLFAELSLEQEIQLLSERQGLRPLHKWLTTKYPQEVSSPLLIWFKKESSLLRQAVAVILINQGKQVDDVINQFEKDSKTSRDWYHNYHIGALYWLYSLYKKQKHYSGFQTIIGVAGNNTRVALDLCYAIIEQWLAIDDKQTLPINSAIQSTAIHEQSETYFRKLVEKGQDSKQFHRFVQRLGRLFEIIHKGPRQSEPEINHFKLKDEADDEITTFLSQCRTEAILRWLPGNKQKSLADEQRDAWQLHPRYGPHFNISWRRKKAMLLTNHELRIIAFGKESEWKKLVTSMDKRYRRISRESDNGQKSLAL